MATNKKKTKGKKAPPKGNGGFMSGVDMGKEYTRDNKRRTASGKPAVYKVLDAVVKATLGLSGTALYKAAAAHLLKRHKRQVTWQALERRYGHLSAGPQVMALRALMRGGGKALDTPAASPKDVRKKKQATARKAAPTKAKAKSKVAAPKRGLKLKHSAPKLSKAPVKKAAPRKRAAKPPAAAAVAHSIAEPAGEAPASA